MSVRGASAEAVAGLRDRLAGVPDPSTDLGRDLFGIAAVLRSEPALRRLATDVSTDSAAKAGLMRSLFDGKVDAVALDLVADAVSRRWTATRDLADAIELLGVIAVVRSGGVTSAQASRLADELFGIAQTINDNPELRTALSDPARSTSDKRGLLRTLLEGKVLPESLVLAEQALSGAYRTVNLALTEFQKVAASVRKESVAEVRVAQDLSDAERTRLQRALTQQYGREVHLNVVVDPSLLGGMRVEIGDDVIDGTVAGRIDEARRKLAG
ncbi:F0F1 ATP synthase subunit delta [Nocardioides sp. cx-169]|uniref:F0F1 ATP synthase subunit delta n=1 Tax=Nocardioides sp. cx-169 TaxID=2899080 RepID=UPI001E5B25AE|nr:F0F1 ATP synthase subunit delta [Nocardioides sp. cx-169]MCD4534412.1 F0F1 ATP synthase subunit delta [Nocardioides sp. cx-169]